MEPLQPPPAHSVLIVLFSTFLRTILVSETQLQLPTMISLVCLEAPAHAIRHHAREPSVGASCSLSLSTYAPFPSGRASNLVSRNYACSALHNEMECVASKKCCFCYFDGAAHGPGLAVYTNSSRTLSKHLFADIRLVNFFRACFLRSHPSRVFTFCLLSTVDVTDASGFLTSASKNFKLHIFTISNKHPSEATTARLRSSLAAVCFCCLDDFVLATPCLRVGQTL